MFSPAGLSWWWAQMLPGSCPSPVRGLWAPPGEGGQVCWGAGCRAAAPGGGMLREEVGCALWVQSLGLSWAFLHPAGPRPRSLVVPEAEVVSLNCLFFLPSPGKVPHLLQTQIQDWLQDCDRAGLEVLPGLPGRRMPRQPHRPARPPPPASQP